VHSGGSRDAARRLAAAGSDRWGAARSLAATRRERWAAFVSRRLAALPGVSGGPQQSPGGSQLPDTSGGLPRSSHKVAESVKAMATP
jgi:hypothetical protein